MTRHFLRARVVRDVTVSARRGVVLADGRTLGGLGPQQTSPVGLADEAIGHLDRAVLGGRLPTAPARLLLEGFSRLWLDVGDDPVVWFGDSRPTRWFDHLGDIIAPGADRHSLVGASMTVGELLVLDPGFSGVAEPHPALVERLQSSRWTGDDGRRVWIERATSGDEPPALHDPLHVALRDIGWMVVVPGRDDPVHVVQAVAGAARLAGRPAALLQVVPVVGRIGATIEPVAPEPHPLVDAVAAACGWRVDGHRVRPGDVAAVVDALRA